MNKKWIMIALAAFAIVLAGCKAVSDPEPIAVESVTLDAETLTLAPGATEKLTATVKPDNADDKSVKWSSSDEAVAMVDNDGTIGAIKTGTAIITAQAGGKQVTCTVTVKPNPIAVESITLDATDLTLAPGVTRKLTATVTPSNADDKAVVWSSSNTVVATVDNDGTVTVVSEGTATVTARAGGKEAKCAVTVNETLVKPNPVPDTPNMVEHAHSYSDGKCTICGFPKPTMEGGTIDYKGVLTKYEGSAAEVVIPDGVTEIKGFAFENNTSLESVTIPTSVTKIWFGAFYECKNLENVKYAGTLAEWCAINANDVHLMSNAKHVTMGDGTDLKNLTTLEIPDGVTSIVNGAFRECTNLKCVTIPTSVTGIEWGAFYECESFENVTYKGMLAQWCAMDNDGCLIYHAKALNMSNGTDLKKLTALEIPEGVTSIGKSAFEGCKTLVTVAIPNSVTSIGNSAFSSCDNLKDVAISDSVTSIERTFVGCKSLASVTIPDSVTSIKGAFSSCSSLVSVTIPDSVTSIEDAFSSCKSLTSVTIGKGVTNIGNSAFMYCDNLKDVSIPDGVTSIENQAFYGCMSLTEVTIPYSVKSIGSNDDCGGAFEKCTSLTSVIYKGTQAQWNSITKVSNWDYGTGDYTIICTDGTISK